MRKVLKFVKITFLAFVVAVMGLVAAAWLMQDRIADMAIKKASEAIEAPFGIESISFSFIRAFPLATVQFNGAWLGAHQPSFDTVADQPIDTIARFEKLYISLESRPLLDNIFNILKVEAKGGEIKYSVNENGATNFDFLVGVDSLSTDSPTSRKTPEIELRRIDLSDIMCYYRDDRVNARANVYVPAIWGSANLDSTSFSLVARGGIGLNNCAYGQTNVHKMQQADLDFDLTYDRDTLAIKGLNIKSEGATLDVSGILIVGEQMAVDLSITASALHLAELGKYVPSQVFQDYNLSRTSGTLDLQATLSGIVSESAMPCYDVSFSLSAGRVKWQDYPLMKDIHTRGEITNGGLRNNVTTSLSINALSFNTGGSHVHLSGSVRNFDRLHYDLKSSMQIDLATSRSFIPDSLVQNVKGHVSANINTRGVLPDSINAQFLDYFLQNSSANFHFQNVDIDLDSAWSFQHVSGRLGYRDSAFELDSFSVYIPKYELSLVNNSLKARFGSKVSDLDAWAIEVPYCHVETPKSSLKGVASVSNLNHPTFSLQSELNIDLAETKPFIPDSLLKSIEGHVAARITSEGTLHLDSLAEQIPDIVYDHSTFDMDLKSVDIEMLDTLLNIHKVNGKVNVTPNLVTVQDLAGQYSGMDFQLDTTVIKNLVNTVIRGKPGKLEVAGVWRLNHLDHNRLDSFMNSDSLESTTSDVKDIPTDNSLRNKDASKKESWNRDYEVKGKLFVKSLKYKNALMADVSTLLNIKDSVYIFDQLKFRAFNGNMRSSILIRLKQNGETEIDLKNKLERMDIRKLLYHLDNFDQKEMTWENISGILSTEEFFTKIVMIGDSVISPKIRMICDFKLEEGGIFNFEPVVILAPSIPGIDRLDTLEFKTIENHVFIFNDTLCVPETYIVSNKMEVSTIGMQGFNEKFQYHLEVYLKELLLGTSKKRRKEKQAMDEIVTKNSKKAKWVMIETNDKGEINVAIFPDKKERERMAVAIRARQTSLNLSFYPKVVSFETHIDAAFKPDL